MSHQGVKFEDENGKYGSRVILGPPETPRLITWFMKVSGGRISTEQQAAYLILTLAGIMIVVSLFLFFGGKTRKAPKFMPPEYKKQLESRLQ